MKALVERLRERQVEKYGTTNLYFELVPDPLCEEAADRIDFLMEDRDRMLNKMTNLKYELQVLKSQMRREADDV